MNHQIMVSKSPTALPLANIASRLIWLSAGVILAATLTPFDFSPATWPARGMLRQFFIYPSDFFDIVGNVILFMPYGLGIAAWLRKQHQGFLLVVLVVLAASTTLSLTVETLQLILPSRTSSAIDIFTNSIGGVLGSALYFLGSAIGSERLPNQSP
jgi:VanZ family protein